MDVGVLDGFERFFDALHADAIVAELSGLYQAVECAEQFGAVVDVGRRAMELHQVEAIGGEIAQAVFDEAGDIALVVAIGGMRREAASGLGGDDDLLLALALQLRDQAFAAAHAVDIGGVDEVDAGIDRAMQGGKRFAIVHAAPTAADRPCAKADLGDLPAGTS